MKIVHFLGSEFWDSTAIYAREIARGEIRDGHSVAFACRDAERVVQRLEKERFNEFARLKIGGFFDFMTPVKVAKLLRPSGMPVAGVKRTRLHVHHHSLLNTAFGALKVSGNEADTEVWLTVGDAAALPSDNKRFDILVDRVDRIVVPEQSVAESLPENLRQKAIVVNPYEALEKPEASNGSQAVELTFVGPLLRGNGFEAFLNAFIATAPNHELRLNVVGEGPGAHVMPMIRRVRSAKLTDRVVWHGDIDPSQELLAKTAMAFTARDFDFATTLVAAPLALRGIEVRDCSELGSEQLVDVIMSQTSVEKP